MPDAKPPWAELVKRFRYVSGDYDDDATFAKVTEVLAELDAPGNRRRDGGNRLFYLATIPSLFGEVAQGLARHRPATSPGVGGSFARLVIEKPFGRDLESAKALDETLHDVLRGAPDLPDRPLHGQRDRSERARTALRQLDLRARLEPALCRPRARDCRRVLGVEHRGAFYESAGALRDIVQNHVMQVLALTLMEPSATMDPTAIRDEKVKLLRAVDDPESRRGRGDGRARPVRGRHDRRPAACPATGRRTASTRSR